MPLLLDDPLEFTPGHGEAVEIYNEIKIVFFSVDIELACLTIRVQYGNTTGGTDGPPTWVPGKVAIRTFIVENRDEYLASGDIEVAADPAWNILVGGSLTSAANVSLYSEVGSNLYQYLIDKGFYEGTMI